MPDEPKAQHEPLPTTQYGFFAWLAKLVAGLSTERVLVMFVCAILGVLIWKQLDQFAEWQARNDRMNAEQRESDKRSCEAEKVQIRADNQALSKAQLDAVRLMQKDLIAFFAAEGEKARVELRAENEKNRMVIVEAMKLEVARLVNGKHEPLPVTALGPPDSPPP